MLINSFSNCSLNIYSAPGTVLGTGCTVVIRYNPHVSAIMDLLLEKRDEYSPFASTWTEVEEIMLSEIRQAEKDNYHMVSLICGTYGITWRPLEGRENEWGDQRRRRTIRDCGL